TLLLLIDAPARQQPHPKLLYLQWIYSNPAHQVADPTRQNLQQTYSATVANRDSLPRAPQATTEGLIISRPPIRAGRATSGAFPSGPIASRAATPAAANAILRGVPNGPRERAALTAKGGPDPLKYDRTRRADVPPGRFRLLPRDGNHRRPL